jgi:hypothetical protein
VAPDEATAYWRDVARQLCVQMGIEPTPGTWTQQTIFVTGETETQHSRHSE